MEALRELLAVDERRALEFFVVCLKMCQSPMWTGRNDVQRQRVGAFRPGVDPFGWRYAGPQGSLDNF